MIIVSIQLHPYFIMYSRAETKMGHDGHVPRMSIGSMGAHTLPVERGRSGTQAFFNECTKAKAFVCKDLAISSSYKMQFAFQFAQVFFSVTAIHFIGKMVHASGSSPALLEYELGYFAFALVGLAVDSYLQAGVVKATESIRQSMNQGVFEAMAATPTAYGLLLFYTSLWPFVFATARVSLFFLFGVIFFSLRLPNANWFGAIVVLSVTIPVFLMLGIISSSIIVLIKRGDPVNWFFSRISAILAGTMFPVSVLPSWLRAIAQCLPLTHSLEAARRCLLTGATLFDVRWHLLTLAVFSGCLAPVTYFAVRVFMQSAKKRGAFATH